MKLSTVETEYIKAREEFRNAMNSETTAKIIVNQARSRLMRARQELRAEDQELLALENMASTSSSQGKS